MKPETPIFPAASLRPYIGFVAPLWAALALGLGCGTASGPVPDPAAEPVASQKQALLAYGQESKLSVATGILDDNLGSGAAISADGSFAILGAPGQDDGATIDTGAAHVFTRSGMTWMATQLLQAPAGDRTANELFGQSVALSADGMTVVIGSEFEDDGGKTNNGAAWVFTAVGGTWTFQAKLLPSDKENGDHFGRSVAIAADGNIVLVGAPDQDEVGTTNNGAAYVFTRSMGIWTEAKKLLATDIASAENLGHAVALSANGKTALVGGANEDDGGLTDNGAAYVFIESAGAWMQQAKLLASNKAASNNFGIAVALSSDGNTALIGAERQSATPPSQNGAGYIFTRVSTSWSQLTMLSAGDAANSDFLGSAVALSGDGELALLGARGKAPTSGGAAYVFVRGGNSYAQQAKLSAADRVNNDNLGKAVSLSADGTRALVASPDVNVGTVNNAGAGYVFMFAPKANGQTCLITRECQTRFCADGVCCDADCGSDDRDCQVCIKPKGASADGTCTFLPPTTVCRVPAGVCDAVETCTGSSSGCPMDARKSNSTVCRPAAGACDAPELCDGSSVDCPANLLRPAGFMCKATGAGIHATCDPADTCDGSRTSCPASFAAFGTACGTAMSCTGTGRCL